VVTDELGEKKKASVQEKHEAATEKAGQLEADAHIAEDAASAAGFSAWPL
jgi:hypothetical protein